MVRTLGVVLLLSGCNWQQPLGPPDDLAPHAPDGTYRGQLELDLRAFVGPFRVKRELCTQDFDMVVDTHTGVAGGVECDLGEYGVVEVVLLGEIRQMPWVGGDVESDEFAGGWDGWFYDEDRLYGETVGETKTDQGVRVEWYGWFDTVHDPATDPRETLEGLEGAGGGIR